MFAEKVINSQIMARRLPKKQARGYDEYRKSLLLTVDNLPTSLEYGEGSSDDLSSDWETESEDHKTELKRKVYK